MGHKGTRYLPPWTTPAVELLVSRSLYNINKVNRGN